MTDQTFLYTFTPLGDVDPELNEALRQIADSLFSIVERLNDIEARLDELESS